MEYGMKMPQQTWLDFVGYPIFSKQDSINLEYHSNDTYLGRTFIILMLMGSLVIAMLKDGGRMQAKFIALIIVQIKEIKEKSSEIGQSDHNEK